MEVLPQIASVLGVFLMVALSARQLGEFFPPMRLPLITGFLFAGVLAGPWVLGIITTDALTTLQFIDHISLSIIAFAAGAELYIRDLRNQIKGIITITTGQLLITLITGGMATWYLAGFIPGLDDPAVRIAAALLAAAILLARSPSSAIAVIKETRAKGPFTQTSLGVTVIIDVLVIVVFAFAMSWVRSMFQAGDESGVIAAMGAQILFALGFGWLIGMHLSFVLSLRLHSLLKKLLIVVSGYAAFTICHHTAEWTGPYLPFTLEPEPLLPCMIGAFIVANYSTHRTQLLSYLNDIGPPIYVMFFTLTGASLTLGILTDVWMITLALFAVRILSILAGSWLGGIAAGLPARTNRISWMAFVTQAGVGLGLAKGVADQFPGWGQTFATVIISVIIVNQILGPSLFKWALHYAGEARSKGDEGAADGTNNALIFGLEGQSLALARSLKSHNWEVKIATRKTLSDPELEKAGVVIAKINEISLASLRGLGAGHTEAVVCFRNDDDNYRICELIYQHFSHINTVVRLEDQNRHKEFMDLGVHAVIPAMAITSLMDHFVRSPAGTSLLLGLEEGQDVIDIEMRNEALHGVPLHDIRLPLDCHVMSIHRRGALLAVHGYTSLKIRDHVSVVGSTESLDQVQLIFAGS